MIEDMTIGMNVAVHLKETMGDVVEAEVLEAVVVELRTLMEYSPS